MKSFPGLLVFFLLLFSRQNLPAQNDGLDFDGCGDYITLNPINGGWSTTNSDFTVEMWFTAPASDNQACASNFRRLFVVSLPHRFEVGRCGPNLKIFWTGTAGSPGVVNIPPPSGVTINDGNWHCIGVRRQASPALVEVYLDGTLVYSSTILTTLNTSMFRLGHWHGGATCSPQQDWVGKMDEVRLWNVALPASELQGTCRHCVRTGSEANLMAYWRLDDGVAGQSNTGITTVDDCTANNNDGVFHPNSGPDPGHDLTDPNGNFLAGVPIPQLIYPQYTKLTLEIQSAGPTPNVNLTEICSGEPVRVCLKDPAGNIPPPGSPFAPVITWECSNDGGATFNPVPYAGFSNSQFCFQVGPGNVTASNCGSPSPGYEDKIFRAKFVVTDPVSGKSCTYFSSNYPLRICCPITPTPVVSNVVINPLGTLNGTLCQGDQINIDAMLTNLPAWFPPAGSAVVTVDWEIDDGFNLYPLNLPPLTTQITALPWTVGGTQFCLRAIIQNCGCPPVTVQWCVPVDPPPVCPTASGCDPALMSPSGTCPAGMTCYDICPGEDAKICYAPTSLNCNPAWEFSFDQTTWVPLGSSNPIQNTNTLPCDDPSSPYEWPAGQQCIWYRILCSPPNSPSGCEPCTSNVVRVCLKPLLDPPVVSNITGSPICMGSFATLVATNPPQNPPVTYTWYCNGLVVDGPGSSNSSYNATQQGYYWVVITDICGQTAESNHVFLQVCVVTADISCPLAPNECAVPGQPLYLSGCGCCGDPSTCGGPYTYAWTVTPNTGTVTVNGCDLTHNFPTGPTTYTLTVTDGNGCTATTSETITPCQ